MKTESDFFFPIVMLGFYMYNFILCELAVVVSDKQIHQCSSQAAVVTIGCRWPLQSNGYSCNIH